MTTLKTELNVDYSMIPIVEKNNNKGEERKKSLYNYVNSIENIIGGKNGIIANSGNLGGNILEQYNRDSKIITESGVSGGYNFPENKIYQLFKEGNFSKDDMIKYTLETFFNNINSNGGKVEYILPISGNSIDNKKGVEYNTYKHFERVLKGLDSLGLQNIKLAAASYPSEFKKYKDLIKSLYSTTDDVLSDKKLKEQMKKIKDYDRNFGDRIDRYITQNINNPEAAKKYLDAATDTTNKKIFLGVGNTDNKGYYKKAMKSTVAGKINEEKGIVDKYKKVFKILRDPVGIDMLTRISESSNDKPNVYGKSIEGLGEKAKNVHMHINGFGGSTEKTKDMVSKALEAKKKELEN